MFYEKTVLENGITVVTEHMDGVRSAALGFWMHVGNRDEEPSTYGMSHFMEHMLFKGTPTRSASDISMAFDALGADLNAFTSREYTCFYARMIDEHLNDGFEILADMLVNASFSQDTIEPEREVVLEEIARSEDQPDDMIYDVLAKAMLPDHPLGNPVLGNKETVSSFATSDMLAYHEQHYVTGNLIVVACGSVDHAQVVRMTQEHLGQMRKGQRSVRNTSQPQGRALRALVHKETEQAHILVGVPSIRMTDPRRRVVSLLDMALGGGMSSRLFQEIREKRGLVYSVYGNTQMHEETGVFSVYAGTRPENVKTVVDLITEEFARIAEKGVTQEELDRVRELMCGHFVLSMESTRTHMTRLGRLLTCDVEPTSIDEVLEGYRKITVADMNEVARELYRQEPTIAVVSPIEEGELARTLA